MSKQYILSKFDSGWKESIEKAIENKARSLDLLNRGLPELPGEPYVSRSTFDDLWITYPYDKNLKTEIKRIFQEAGWKLTWEVTEAEIGERGGNPRCQFSTPAQSWDDRVTVIVEFSHHEKGATCKRVEIGTTVKEFPVYEYVCGEGGDQDEETT